MKIHSARKSLYLLFAVVSLTMCPWPASATVRRDPPATIHGAVYVPSNAYNAPQLWKFFNLQEAKRDFGYAHEIHVNALRVWASYEFWRMNPSKFQSEFDQMLGAADDKGIRILISLFENDGVPPTDENMWTTDPTKAFDIQSPGRAIAAGDTIGWEAPRGFVRWFMKRYGSNDRVLAIEVMNEPNVGKNGAPGTVPFAQSMFSTAKSLQGTVPLTLGSDRIEVAQLFIPLGLDIIQYHVNFPRDTEELVTMTKSALALGEKTGLPVWLTEWQRLRTSASGFGAEKISAAERTSDYASMAATIREYPVGSFFWCLMAKRAYLKGQRLNGTVNGLFWPDGSVTSLKDARAIANDPKLQLKETPFPANYGMEAVR
jgi:Cellulase (glycosyl hydrolase family 5)